MDESGSQRRPGSAKLHYGPVVWITVLLAGWFIISHWDALPRLITSTMGGIG